MGWKYEGKLHVVWFLDFLHCMMTLNLYKENVQYIWINYKVHSKMLTHEPTTQSQNQKPITIIKIYVFVPYPLSASSKRGNYYLNLSFSLPFFSWPLLFSSFFNSFHISAYIYFHCFIILYFSKAQFTCPSPIEETELFSDFVMNNNAINILVYPSECIS